MSSKTNPVALAVAVTVAVAAVLRFAGLGSSLWYDEIVTLVDSARLPVREIVTTFPGVNTHPLYSLAAHGSLAAFGESPWALRLPACLFGIACVWMAYLVAAEVLERVEAWAGAAVLATSYHHVWFSQNARGYTMMGFFALLSTWAVLRAEETGRRSFYVMYALACAAGIYTHLTMAFVVAGQVVVLLGGYVAGWKPVRARIRRGVAPLMWSWIGAGGVAVLLYTPFIPGLIAHLGVEAPVEAAQVATGSWALSEAIRSVLSGAGVPAAIAGGLVAILGAFSLWRRSPLMLALLLMPAVVTAVVVIGLHQPLRPRFFFFLSGAAAVFVGGGLGVIATVIGRAVSSERLPVVRQRILVGAALVLALTSAAALPRNYAVPKQDFDGAVRFLEQQEAGGARIASAGPACWPLEHYYGKRDTWPCLATLADLTALSRENRRTLVVVTLSDYIVDAPLREYLRGPCQVTKTFPGTLGGGDMVVCAAHPGEGL